MILAGALGLGIGLSFALGYAAVSSSSERLSNYKELLLREINKYKTKLENEFK